MNPQCSCFTLKTFAQRTGLHRKTPCSFGLSVTSQQYFSLRTNQPPAISQQYFSLTTNQHQPSATSQTNRSSPHGNLIWSHKKNMRQAPRAAMTKA
jgi:hypothetical protein